MVLGRKAISIVLPGAPRTKKTSNRAFVTKGGLPLVHPSEAFEAWLKHVLSFRPIIHRQLTSAGIEIPIEQPVGIAALIYRDRDTGDATGYYQAIGDALQDGTFLCKMCRRVVHESGVIAHSGSCRGQLSRKRKGLGILLDDKQIEHWDRSRRLIDSKNPRVELEIVPFEPDGEQMSLMEGADGAVDVR